MAARSITQRAAQSLPVILPQLVSAGRFASEKSVAEHSHAGAEFVLVLEGHLRIRATEWLEGGTDTVFVLPPRVSQLTIPRGFVRAVYVIFQASTNLLDTRERTVQLPANDLFAIWADQLCGISRSSRSSASAGGLLLAAAARLNEIEVRQNEDRAQPQAVARALEFMETHWSQPIQVSEIAGAAHVSPSHLSALFQQHVGRSPIQCLQGLRMRAAQRLLLDPYQNVGSVAAACGYDDPGYFVRLFRKIHGESPGRWRKKARRS